MEYRQMTEMIKGKQVLNISEGCDGLKREGDYSIESVAGDITIEFMDGSKLLFWLSEWGGIVYHPK